MGKVNSMNKTLETKRLSVQGQIKLNRGIMQGSRGRNGDLH